MREQFQNLEMSLISSQNEQSVSGLFAVSSSLQRAQVLRFGHICAKHMVEAVGGSSRESLRYVCRMARNTRWSYTGMKRMVLENAI